MANTQTTVMIAGQEFRISGTEDAQYIQSVAKYVDEKVAELLDKYPHMGTHAGMVLTALNLADELFKMKEQYAELDQRIQELRNMPRMSMPERPQRASKAAPVKHPFEQESGTF